MTYVIPGPRADTKRPSLKITAPLYSLKILIPLMINKMAITKTVATMPKRT
jgi:hypothetical protein